ncbi:MAG: DUF7544 domain-containing protein [Anaerolineae bacterium]
MDHVKILKRTVDITWRYRALWLFGVLAAVFAGGTTGSGGGNSGYSFGGGDVGRGLGRMLTPQDWTQIVAGIIVIMLVILAFVVVLSLIGVVLRYLSETALIRMVNDYEETGIKRSVGYGFRLGWSRATWRLFLIDLLITVPTALVFVLLFLLALSTLLLWGTGNETLGLMGTIATVGLIFLVVLLLLAVVAVLSLLRPFFWRVCALQDKGVIESISQGYAMVRRHLRDAGSMWLILIGVQIVWSLVMIPVMICLVLLGLLAGGLPALLVVSLVSLVSQGAPAWLLGVAVGIPIFILVVAVPALFLNGLWLVFKSSTWTLTYRELRALESVQAA